MSTSSDNLKSRIFIKFYSFSHFVIKQEVVVESIFELVDCLLRETDPGQNTHYKAHYLLKLLSICLNCKNVFVKIHNRIYPDGEKYLSWLIVYSGRQTLARTHITKHITF